MPASLYDAMLRHQTFLEGLKANENGVLEKGVLFIFNTFLDEISALEVDTLDQLTQKKIKEILASMRLLVIRMYSKYTIEFIDFLKRFVKAETTITAMLIKGTDTALARFVPLKTFGRAFIDDMWANIQKAEIPANALTVVKYIDQFGNSIVEAISKALKMAVLNAERPRELRDTILGTIGKEGVRKGGILKRFVNYAKAVVETSIQHVSAQVQNKVQELFYDEYTWVSVIDQHTTDICTTRDQRVYRYGEGPLPPAHVRCRSKPVPRPAIPKDRKNYAEWFTDQPEDVQDEMLKGLKGLSLRDYEIQVTRMME